MNDQTEEEVRAFVSPRADYYLKKWWLDLDSMGSATGFNWAAFFLSGLWLPYRKMYRATTILYGIILLETILEEIVFVGILGKPETPRALGRFVSLVAAIVCGAFGNDWYLSHSQKAITEVRNQALAADAHFQALAKRGGTSAAASLGFLMVLLFAAVAMAFLSELLLKRV
jgi:hypothetical protein